MRGGLRYPGAPPTPSGDLLKDRVAGEIGAILLALSPILVKCKCPTPKRFNTSARCGHQVTYRTISSGTSVNNDACASFSYPSERRGDRSNAVTRVKASTPPRQSHAFQDAANGLRRRHLHPCRCARPASLVSHAAEQCRRATTPDVDVSHRLPYQTHQFVIRCLWLRLVSHLDGRWFPELSSGVLTSVDASSGCSIVVPPGLMLALGLAQRFSSVEALVKVQV